MFGDVSKSERPAKLCRDPQMVRKEEKKTFTSLNDSSTKSSDSRSEMSREEFSKSGQCVLFVKLLINKSRVCVARV